MQVGALPHFCQSVRNALNERFHNAWIGMGQTNLLASQKPTSHSDGLFFCGDTTRTLCMVTRFGISDTYATGSQQPSQV
jgi:hypothetical protein